MRSGPCRVVTLAAIAAVGLVGSFASTRRMINVTSTRMMTTVTQTTKTNCSAAAIDRRCFPWTVDTDGWWTHHPEYEVSLQNETHFCYSRIDDEDQVNFVRDLYESQWKVDCSNDYQKQEMTSGMGSLIDVLTGHMLAAYKNGRPYQSAIAPGVLQWNLKWMYAAPNNSSWAWCETGNIKCYLLPFGGCPTVPGRLDGDIALPSGKRIKEQERVWTRRYVRRLQQNVRRHVYELIHNRTVFPSYDNLATANHCTVMHVRRGDAGLLAPPFRRYAAVSEYIEAAHIGRGETILLLTDDESTLAEIAEFHADDYDWVYSRRPRVNLTQGGFSGHTPSNDGAFEFTLMEAEFELGTCVCVDVVLRNYSYKFVLIFCSCLTLQRCFFCFYTTYVSILPTTNLCVPSQKM